MNTAGSVPLHVDVVHKLALARTDRRAEHSVVPASQAKVRQLHAGVEAAHLHLLDIVGSETRPVARGRTSFTGLAHNRLPKLHKWRPMFRTTAPPGWRPVHRPILVGPGGPAPLSPKQQPKGHAGGRARSSHTLRVAEAPFGRACVSCRTCVVSLRLTVDEAVQLATAVPAPAANQAGPDLPLVKKPVERTARCVNILAIVREPQVGRLANHRGAAGDQAGCVGGDGVSGGLTR